MKKNQKNCLLAAVLASTTIIPNITYGATEIKDHSGYVSSISSNLITEISVIGDFVMSKGEEPNLKVGTNKTINGNNHTITGNSTNIRAYTKDSTVFTINNLTFDNFAYTNGGGGALGLDSGTINLYNVTIKNSSPAYTAENRGGGGAIASEGTLSITDSSFLNNYAQANRKGGALVLFSKNCFTNLYAINKDVTFTGNGVDKSSNTVTGYGGAIYNIGTLTLAPSQNNHKYSFNGNRVNKQGGAIWNSGTATIVDAVFIDNEAGELGGAIYNSGNMSLDGVSFSGNKANGVNNDIVNTGTLTFANNMSTLTTDITDGGTGTTGTVGFKNITFDTKDYSFKIKQKNLVVAADADVTASDDKLILAADGTIDNAGKFTFTAGNSETQYALNNTIVGSGNTIFTAASDIKATKSITQKSLVNNGKLTIDADNLIISSGDIINTGTLTLLGGTLNENIQGSGTLNISGVTTSSGSINQNFVNVQEGGDLTNTGNVEALMTSVQEGGKATGLTIDKRLSVFGSVADTTIKSGGIMYFYSGASATDTKLENGTIQLALGGTTFALGNVTSSGSTINVAYNNEKSGSYSTANRNLAMSSFSGDATFALNADLANNASDSISIDTANNAAATLKITFDPFYDEYKGLGEVRNGKARVLTIGNGTLSVSAKETDWGAIRFTPTITNNGDGTYDLTALQGSVEKVGPSENTMTAADARAVINEAWLVDTNSLSKRLGDLRADNTGDDGVWARFQRTNNKSKGDRQAKLNANLFQVGYDKSFQRKNGKTYVGVAVDHIDGNGNYESGSGEVKATSVALYNTWLGESGHYYDVILRQGHYSNDYSLIDLAGIKSKADYGVNATTLSGEYGYRKTFKNSTYIEPQGEIIYGHLTGSDYISLNRAVNVEATNHAITRLGIAVGKGTKQGDYYAKASYYHDFAGGGGVTFNGYNYERDAAKNWAELTMGGDVMLGKDWRVYGEISKSFGDVKNSLNYDIGVRFSF